MNLIDVAPTVFEAMGTETPPDMQGPGSSRVESSASLGRKTCSRLSPSPFFTVMSMALSATATFQTVKCLTLVEQVVRSLVGLGMVVIFYLLGSILVAIAAYALSMAGGVTLAHFSEAYVTRIARPRHSGEVRARGSIQHLRTDDYGQLYQP